MPLLGGRRRWEALPEQSLIGACTEDTVCLYTYHYFEIHSLKAGLEISFENIFGELSSWEINQRQKELSIVQEKAAMKHTGETKKTTRKSNLCFSR